MSENEQPQEPENVDEEPTTTVGVVLPEVSEDEASGYAVFDHTLVKYVSGVVTKSEANRIAKQGPEGHQYEVRRV